MVPTIGRPTTHGDKSGPKADKPGRPTTTGTSVFCSLTRFLLPSRQSFVSPFRLILSLLAVSAFAADWRLDNLLQKVEDRYNRAKTLQVLFTEQYTPPGSIRRTESGTLQLRKPGRMRWDYSQPKGKLFVSDGKFLWIYTPSDNRAEKMKFKESDDMRAPLAFLLGKLHFDKEFRNLTGTPEGPDTRIMAEPKTDNLPYSAVEFLVTPQGIIREVKVTGFDHSLYRFTFDLEKMDPPLDAKLFQFQTPPGAVLEETSQ
jgi:outer membrane lipoprotein carrier protein